MRFQTELVPGTLIRRYKRFLADVRLADGTEALAHCPNPGAMTGLAEPGARIWLEPNDDQKKKLDFGWRLTELGDGHYAGIDTGAANRVVAEALAGGRLPGLEGYDTIRAEVTYGAGSRVDFVLTGQSRPEAFVEVKSVTLSRATGLAEFPDTVTKRGARHMRALAKVANGGRRAVVLYLVQRTDCSQVAIAGDIDPDYAAAATEAHAAGVEAIAVDTSIGPDGIETKDILPLNLH